MAASDHAHVVSGKVHKDAHIAPSCGESFEHAHFIAVSLKLARRSAVRTPQLRRTVTAFRFKQNTKTSNLLL